MQNSRGRRALVVVPLLIVVLGVIAVLGYRAWESRLLSRFPGGRGPETSQSDRYGEPTRVGALKDRDITESSGVAASWIEDGRYWTHNDSGDRPALYCFEESGRSCGTWRINGVPYAFDWEDMAAGPGPDTDRPHLYVGDIGDNQGRRRGITVWAFPEPEGGVSSSAEPVLTEPAIGLKFTYPDGPHDAEALLVHPKSRDIYVITKSPARVYRAASPFKAGAIERMKLVAELDVEGVTAADIARNGRRVVLATYGMAYEFVLATKGPFEEVWDGRPTRFSPGPPGQREAIAYSRDASSVLSTTEGSRAAIYEVTTEGG